MAQQQMVTTRDRAQEQGRFVDPAVLVCWECRDQVRAEPPASCHTSNGEAAPGFSHLDGTALCRTRITGRPGEPIEACGGELR